MFYRGARIPEMALKCFAIQDRTASCLFISRIGLAGKPQTTSPSLTSPITELPPPTITFDPIVRLSAIPTFPAIVVLSPIVVDPEMPLWPAMIVFLPILTLCAT